MAARDLHELTILVVDDRASVCEILSRMLGRLGIRRVQSAGTGAEALAMIAGARDPFDVAIFDIDMPTDDGLVCIRKLAREDVRPAVILMSGKDPIVLESAQRLGVGLGVNILGTLPKPVDLAALAQLLEQYDPLQGSTQFKPSMRLSGAEVAEALEGNRFELWFQPQFDIRRRSVYGVEGLLRLHSSDRGLLTPDTFIRPAEDAGLIGRLTDFVLEDAALWCAAWNQAGHRVTIAVNLSKAGLWDLTMPDRAAAICQQRGVSPSQFVFELTESSLAADQTALLDILTRLRLKGFRLSLDDFGTGYASLEELRLLPFHELKLDKQFVQTALSNPRSRAILDNSIALARDLKMTVVAEGVETEDMLALIGDLGCDVAQGYYFGRPMPASDILAWMAGSSAFDLPPSAAVPAQAGSSADLERDAFSAEGVLHFAHDSAGPLMMVLTLSELLLDDAGLHEDQRRDVMQIHQAAQELTAMIKALQKQVRDAGGKTRMLT